MNDAYTKHCYKLIFVHRKAKRWLDAHLKSLLLSNCRSAMLAAHKEVFFFNSEVASWSLPLRRSVRYQLWFTSFHPELLLGDKLDERRIYCKIENNNTMISAVNKQLLFHPRVKNNLLQCYRLKTKIIGPVLATRNWNIRIL